MIGYEATHETARLDEDGAFGACGRRPIGGAVTALPGRVSKGGAASSEELVTFVYEDLRRLADRCLASESRRETLQPTALVHEVYLRLAGRSPHLWENRAHFFAAAARAIRRILIDRARWRNRDRHGGGGQALPLESAMGVGRPGPRLDLVALDEALERLARIDEQKARVVELRFFGGLSAAETAAALGISASTVAREWRFARVWLHRELDGREAG